MVPTKIDELFQKFSPAIIAPTHLKGLPSSEFREIWSSARLALQYAKHIIVIGYSLPPSDTIMWHLLRSSLRFRLRTDSDDQPRVTVINPDRTGVVKSRYHRLLEDSFEFLKYPFLEVDLEVTR